MGPFWGFDRREVIPPLGKCSQCSPEHDYYGNNNDNDDADDEEEHKEEENGSDDTDHDYNNSNEQ